MQQKNRIFWGIRSQSTVFSLHVLMSLSRMAVCNQRDMRQLFCLIYCKGLEAFPNTIRAGHEAA
jgi:hypothetical protein